MLKKVLLLWLPAVLVVFVGCHKEKVEVIFGQAFKLDSPTVTIVNVGVGGYWLTANVWLAYSDKGLVVISPKVGRELTRFKKAVEVHEDLEVGEESLHFPAKYSGAVLKEVRRFILKSTDMFSGIELRRGVRLIASADSAGYHLWLEEWVKKPSKPSEPPRPTPKPAAVPKKPEPAPAPPPKEIKVGVTVVFGQTLDLNDPGVKLVRARFSNEELLLAYGEKGLNLLEVKNAEAKEYFEEKAELKVLQKGRPVTLFTSYVGEIGVKYKRFLDDGNKLYHWEFTATKAAFKVAVERELPLAVEDIFPPTLDLEKVSPKNIFGFAGLWFAYSNKSLTRIKFKSPEAKAFFIKAFQPKIIIPEIGERHLIPVNYSGNGKRVIKVFTVPFANGEGTAKVSIVFAANERGYHMKVYEE